MLRSYDLVHRHCRSQGIENAKRENIIFRRMVQIDTVEVKDPVERKALKRGGMLHPQGDLLLHYPWIWIPM
jgi:hypothetical protein